jgi:hypothetical protein
MVVLAVMLLASCAASGRIGELPKIDNPAECGKVVVVRISCFVGSAINYTVALDGRDLFYIHSGEHTEFLVQPGDHYIAVKCFGGWTPTWKEDSKKFVASAAAVNYFKISPSMSCADIISIAADEANALLPSSKFINLSKTASSN